MNYKEVINEIETKAAEIDKIAAQVYMGSSIDYGYGKGCIKGITSTGVEFDYYHYEDREWYLIPLFWLEMHPEDLREMLTKSRKEKEDNRRLDEAAVEAARKALIENQERAMLTLLKRKYES